jgi:hypothetical protein
MKFSNVAKLSDLLSIVEPQKEIIKSLMSLKERGLSYNSVSLALYAIYHFYEMNDIALNKKKINMFKGEFTRKISDRAYTYEEIRKILDISDLRMKSNVLLMASSGHRIGSIPLLRLETQRDRLGLYLSDAKDFNNKITIERLITDIDFKVIGVMERINQSTVQHYNEVIEHVNKIAEKEKLKIRYTSLFELYRISIDSRQDLNKLKEIAWGKQKTRTKG